MTVSCCALNCRVFRLCRDGPGTWFCARLICSQYMHWPLCLFSFFFLLTLSSCSSLAEFPAGRLKVVIELLIN